ncbi:MAG: hypothetical protein ACKVTZ_11130, partial [Bacteroidia bacterium]
MNKSLFFSALLGAIALGMTSCTRDTITEQNIDYPAAYIINGGSNSISVINLNTQEVSATIDLSKMYDKNDDVRILPTNITFPHHAGLSPDGKTLAVAAPRMDLSEGHAHSGSMESFAMIALTDAKTGLIQEIIDMSFANHNAIYSPDGSEIWTSQMKSTGQVKVFPSDGLSPAKNEITVGKYPAEITLSNDKTKFFIANSGANTISVVDVATKTVIKTINVGESPIGAWTGSDNKLYVDCEIDSSLHIIDVASLAVEETINLGFMPGMAAYNGNLNELWVTNADADSVVYFSRENNAWAKKGAIQTGTSSHALAFTQDGKTLYVT